VVDTGLSEDDKDAIRKALEPIITTGVPDIGQVKADTEADKYGNLPACYDQFHKTRNTIVDVPQHCQECFDAVLITIRNYGAIIMFLLSAGHDGCTIARSSAITTWCGVHVMWTSTGLQEMLSDIAESFGYQRDYWTEGMVYSLLKLLQQSHPPSAKICIALCRSVCTYAGLNLIFIDCVASNRVLDRTLFQEKVLEAVSNRNFNVLVNSQLHFQLQIILDVVKNLQPQQNRHLICLKVSSFILGIGRGTNSCHKVEVLVPVIYLDVEKPVRSFAKQVADKILEDRCTQVKLAIAEAEVKKCSTATVKTLKSYLKSLNVGTIAKEVYTAITTIGLNHGIPHLLSLCINGESEIKFVSQLWNVVESEASTKETNEGTATI